jgi:type I restriction enzyme S subunit
MQADWLECTLGEVCFTTSGGTPSRQNKDFYKGNIPWVKSGELDKGVIYDSEEHISEVAIKKSSAKIFPKGTLLFALYGATIGKMATLGVDASTNQAICGIYKSSAFNSEYLYHYLFYKKNNLIQQGIGGAQPNISQTILKKLNISIAPLIEQKAIVKKIEELFSSLDNGIADLKKAQEQLVIYRQAVLKKAFEGELTKEWRGKNSYSMDGFLKKLNKEKETAIESKLISKSIYFPVFEEKELIYKTPKSWISLPWKTTTSNNKYAMKRGPFGSALKKEFFVDKGIVVYEQGHAINNEPFRHRYYITSEKFRELKAFKTKGGDMIISCSGATLGRICLLPENADVGVINQALLKIDLDEKILFKNFFLLMFRSETFQRMIFAKSLGTAMPNMIGMKELKEIPIPIPSIEEQKQIIKEVESRLSVCDAVEKSIEESLLKATALRQSILKKAFEGKLLSKEEIAKCKVDKNYEPASVLLEKIKLEKKKK